MYFKAIFQHVIGQNKENEGHDSSAKFIYLFIRFAKILKLFCHGVYVTKHRRKDNL
jgi:hypothetical protein